MIEQISLGQDMSAQFADGRNNQFFRSTDGSVNLAVAIEKSPRDAAETIKAQGSVTLEDGQSRDVEVAIQANRNGQSNISVSMDGKDLSLADIERSIKKVVDEISVGVEKGDIDVDNKDLSEAVRSSASTSFQDWTIQANQDGTLSASLALSAAKGSWRVESPVEVSGNRELPTSKVIDRTPYRSQSATSSDVSESPVPQRRESRVDTFQQVSSLGGSNESPKASNVTPIGAEELRGLASSNDYQLRSQGNVEGNYFSKTADGNLLATVSTKDRKPGFWNGNRAEIAFNESFRKSDTTSFRSFFDVLQGKNFSIFQMFNAFKNGGFPEAMLIVEDGRLKLGGRAFRGEGIDLGALPDGRFGLDVKFQNGKVSVQLLNESGSAASAVYSANVTEPDGEFHYRAGPYFNGHNDKQFSSDMENITAQVEIIEPTMRH